MSKITLKNVAFTFTVAELSIDRSSEASPFSVLASLLSCAAPVDGDGDGDGDEGADDGAAEVNAAPSADPTATATATPTTPVMPSAAEVGAFLKSSDKPLRTLGAIMKHFGLPEGLTEDVERLLEDMVADGTLERRTSRADSAALWGHADRVGL